MSHNYEDTKFAAWKKKHGLNEEFLDGSEEESVSVEDTNEEDQKKGDGSSDSIPDFDISEEPAENDSDDKPADDTFGEGPSEDKPSEDSGDEQKDSMEDFGEDGDTESKEDDGVSHESDTETELKDILSTLTTAIQTLTDKVDNIAKAEPEAEEAGESEPGEDDTFGDTSMDDFSGEGSEDEGSSEEGSSEEGSSEEGSSEEGSSEEGSSEEGSSEGESSSEGEGSSEEDEEEPPADETKTEAFNYFSRKGRPLSEKSDYLIGKVYNSRYDMLESDIMTAVKAKLRTKIEAAKKQLKMEAVQARQAKKNK